MLASQKDVHSDLEHIIIRQTMLSNHHSYAVKYISGYLLR